MRILFYLICWVLPLVANAQALQKANDAQSREMIAKINSRAAELNSIECDFTQVKTLRFLNDKMTSQGKMYFGGKDKLRWEYTKPYVYTFIINGQKVYMKSSKSSQTVDMRQSRLFQSIAQVMMNSVTGKSLSASSEFGCTMYTAANDWVAVMIPKKKEMKKMFKEIKLHFSPTRQMVDKVEMTEQSGDLTVITLRDVKTNVKIDEKKFAAP